MTQTAAEIKAEREAKDHRLFDPSAHLIYPEKEVLRQMVNEWGEDLEGIHGWAGAKGPVSLDGGSHTFGLDIMELEAGRSFPLHVHPGNHILYVLSGSALVRINGKDWPVEAGASIWIPCEYPHAVTGYPAEKEPNGIKFVSIGYPHRMVDGLDRMRVVDEEIRVQHGDPMTLPAGSYYP